MNKRTPDHEKCASKKFFEDPKLLAAVNEFFEGTWVKERIAEGYLNYQESLEEIKGYAPEDVDCLDKVMEKYSMPKETYYQETFETFKCMLASIMSPAAVVIPLNELVVNLLKKQDDVNLMILLDSALDDIFDYMIPRAMNVVTLISDGLPLEVAEEIANQVGEAEIIPVEIEVSYENDEEDASNETECCGECGGHCDCEGKNACHESGHCQYEEEGCNCGNNTDK